MTMRLSRRALLASVYATGLAACAGAPGLAGRPGGARPDATEIAAMIARGDISAAEAVEAAIARAQAVQPQLNFMVADTFEAARGRARAPLSGPFAGVPYLAKDLNDVPGAVTRMGSRVTTGRPPATEVDEYVGQALGAGLVCIGKSATPEYGYLPTTEPLAFGPTRNPWNSGHSSGGSSGGAAAAVAAGVVPIAHANDGGGSIRFPAANCGLVGLKPSRGRQVDGGGAPGPLDIAVQGCVSVSVRDTARMLAATERKGASAILPPVGMISTPVSSKLRVGVLTRGFAAHEADAEVAAIVRLAGRELEGMGHTVSETRWPTPASFSDDFLAFWSLGAAQDIAGATNASGRPASADWFEPFSLRMAQNASSLTPADQGAVIQRLGQATTAYNEWIKSFDIVLSPVFASPPSPLGYLRGDVPFDTLRERLLQQVGYTLIHNVCGAPAISLPLGWSTAGLPVGVQVCAAVGAEALLLQIAYAFEEAMPWTARRPAVFAA
jgi:amidase